MEVALFSNTYHDEIIKRQRFLDKRPKCQFPNLSWCDTSSTQTVIKMFENRYLRTLECYEEFI